MGAEPGREAQGIWCICGNIAHLTAWLEYPSAGTTVRTQARPVLPLGRGVLTQAEWGCQR